jgi:gluconolactonase
MRALSTAVAFVALTVGTAAAQASPVAEGAKPEAVATGYAFTEGPACDAEGNVCFTDQPNDRILRWTPADGVNAFLEPAGRANGLCFDRDGDLWACADARNEMWVIHPDGSHEVKVGGYQGKPLNGPNDVWCAPEGGVYFTDPYYERGYWQGRTGMEQETQGVYWLAPDAEEPVRVAGDLTQPNGLIGTPDGKTLYVADIGAGKTYAYDIAGDASLTDKRLFCELGSDGMTLDDEGNVYLTGQGVTVFGPDGQQVAHIEIPESWTSNVCFGGAERRTLFITAGGSLYTLAMRTRGVGSQ